MADEYDDLLKQGFANTETEIFGEATGKDLPSDFMGTPDRSVEEMGTGLEGQHEPEEIETQGEGGGEGEGEKPDGDGQGEADKTGTEAKGEGDDKGEGEGEGDEGGEGDQERDPETGQFKEGKNHQVPLAELTSERKKRQEAQTALDALNKTLETERQSHRESIDAVNKRLDDVMAALAKGQNPGQQQQQEPEANQGPDVIEDPQGFAEQLTQTITHGVRQQMVAADLERTASGPEAERFNAAYTAITKAAEQGSADARAAIQRAWNSYNPGQRIMEWHDQQEQARQLQEGGGLEKIREAAIEAERERLRTDPAYREQVFGKGAAAPQQGQRQQQQGQQGSAPRQEYRMPRSLNGAAGGSAAAGGGEQPVGDGSDRSVFEDAFR